MLVFRRKDDLLKSQTRFSLVLSQTSLWNKNLVYNKNEAHAISVNHSKYYMTTTIVS